MELLDSDCSVFGFANSGSPICGKIILCNSKCLDLQIIERDGEYHDDIVVRGQTLALCLFSGRKTYVNRLFLPYLASQECGPCCRDSCLSSKIDQTTINKQQISHFLIQKGFHVTKLLPLWISGLCPSSVQNLVHQELAYLLVEQARQYLSTLQFDGSAFDPGACALSLLWNVLWIADGLDILLLVCRYTDMEKDTEFIEVLQEACYKTITHRGLVSLSDIADFIRSKGLSRVNLSNENIESIVDTLIYDGRVDEVEGACGVQYRPALLQLPESSTLASIPCGVCPVFNECRPGGVVSPETCVYYDKWLDF